MSYIEYLDLFETTQKKECPYRAFTFDVVNSKRIFCDIEKHMDYYRLVSHIYTLLQREERKTNTKILLNDEFNQKYKFENTLKNANNNNPILLGDMATYFVYNNSISTQRMIELFVMGLKQYNIDFLFHFATGVYQTNDYAKGGTLMYKGYMPQILEKISKQNNIILNKDVIINEQEIQKN